MSAGGAPGATGAEPTDSTQILLVDEVFTCDDGSGTFTLQQTRDFADPATFDGGNRTWFSDDQGRIHRGPEL